MNLARGTDWRVGPALASPVEKELYECQFLESHPMAQQTSTDDSGSDSRDTHTPG